MTAENPTGLCRFYESVLFVQSEILNTLLRAQTKSRAKLRKTKQNNKESRLSNLHQSGREQEQSLDGRVQDNNSTWEEMETKGCVFRVCSKKL